MNKDYWKNKIVAVTGGSGFIGSHFVEELANFGATVRCIYLYREANIDWLKNVKGKIEFTQLDVLDPTDLSNTCKGVHTLINCAAKDGNLEYKISNPATILDTNVRIVSNVLNTAVKNSIKTVVLISSAEIYPSNAKSPVKEENDYNHNFDNLSNGYVLSKRYSEILGMMYQKQFNMNVYSPRPTNTYGPRDKFDSANRIIPMLIKKIINGELIEIWGDGLQQRSFIYVKDLVWSVMSMMVRKKYTVLNLSSDESVSINQLIKRISDITGKKAKIKYNIDKFGGIKKRVLDNNKLKSIIDFQLKSIDEGLLETINWFKNIQRP